MAWCVTDCRSLIKSNGLEILIMYMRWFTVKCSGCVSIHTTISKVTCCILACVETNFVGSLVVKIIRRCLIWCLMLKRCYVLAQQKIVIILKQCNHKIMWKDKCKKYERNCLRKESYDNFFSLFAMSADLVRLKNI